MEDSLEDVRDGRGGEIMRRRRGKIQEESSSHPIY